MSRFYLTFGKRGLMDGWVEIRARDYDEARAWVIETYGRGWSSLYTEQDWDPTYFPHGPFGEVFV